MTQKPKKGENKKGFGSSSPRFDPASTNLNTSRNPSDLSGSGHMGSAHPGRVSMTHSVTLHQGGNQEVRDHRMGVTCIHIHLIFLFNSCTEVVFACLTG